MKNITLLLFYFLSLTSLFTQPDFYNSYNFTEADTLRGMLRPERTCYDVTFYELKVKVDPTRQFISGAVNIHFQTLEDFDRLQIDLYQNMDISSIEFEGEELLFTRQHDAVFIDFPKQT